MAGVFIMALHSLRGTFDPATVLLGAPSEQTGVIELCLVSLYRVVFAELGRLDIGNSPDHRYVDRPAKRASSSRRGRRKCSPSSLCASWADFACASSLRASAARPTSSRHS